MQNLLSTLRHVLARISRWPRTHGHGIQSPWAYMFVRNVVDCCDEYYAYATLAELRYHATTAPDALSERADRLLLRLANFIQPAQIVAPHDDAFAISRKYLTAGCHRAILTTYTSTAEIATAIRPTEAALICLRADRPFDMAAIAGKLHPDSLIVLTHLDMGKSGKQLWQNAIAEDHVRQSFHLLDIGLAFVNPAYAQQTYNCYYP